MSNQTPKQKVTPKSLGFFREVALRDKLVLRLMEDPRVNPLIKVIPIASIIYWIVPTDLMPILPFDDAAVVALGYTMFLELCPQDVVQEHQNRLRAEAERAEALKQQGQQQAQSYQQQNENVVDAEFRDIGSTGTGERKTGERDASGR